MIGHDNNYMNKLKKFLKSLGFGIAIASLLTAGIVYADRSWSPPDQTGNAGKFLQTDGTNTLWAAAGGGSVTSITAGAGLSATPNPITTSGTITLNQAYVPYTAVVAPTGGAYSSVATAVAAVCGSGGGSVYVKDGTYTETTTITGCSSLRITLSQGATVQINQTSTGVTTFFSAASGSARIIIEGGKWLQTSGTLGSSVAFDMSNLSNTYIQNTRVEGFNTAVVYNDTTSTTFYNSINNAQFFDDNNCVAYLGTQANSNSIDNLRCRPKAGGAGTGLSLIAARGITIKDSDFEPATATGITGVSIDATSREIEFLNNWIENNATGVSIANGATRIKFDINSITSNTTDITNNAAQGSVVFTNTSRTGTLLSNGVYSIPTAANLVGLTVNQADTTNNPNAMTIANSTTSHGLAITQTGNSSASTSVGGAVLLTNTLNNGSGVVIYSNNATPTSGANLLAVRADNTAFTENVVAISNDGTGTALSINTTGGTGNALSASCNGGTNCAGFNYTGSTANVGALGATSTSTAFTAFQVTGHEFTHGTIKVSHIGDGLSSDANAAGLSIDLKNSDGSTGTTAAQGIFITSTTGGTTGPIMQLKNNLLAFGGADSQVDVFRVNGDGHVGILTISPTSYLQLAPGTASASGSPLKFIAGTNLGTTEAGAMEFDGTHLYFTVANAGTRYQLDQQTGAISSVSNSDGTLTISPTTGAVVASLALAHANTWTGLQTFNSQSLGTSTADSVLINNTTAAAVGAQQISPSLHISGNGWGTTAGTSQSVDYRLNLLPVQGTVPSGTLQFLSSVNGGAYTAQLQLTTAGNITLQGSLLSGQSSSSSAAIGTVGTSNLFSYASNVGTSINTASYLFGGASNVNIRNAFGGSISTVVLGASNNYANTIIASSAVTAAATGTHAVLANLAVTALGTVTNGSSVPITNTASVYINGAGAGGTNNYALMVNSGATYLGGLITSYNGIATAGNGVVSVQGAGRQTGQTAADATVATYTVGASDASFVVSSNVNVTASVTHTIAVQVDYTDEGNVSRTVTLSFSQLAGTIINSITNVTGTGPYEGIPLHIRAKASTAITVKTTGTFTSVTYNVEGVITKLQ